MLAANYERHFKVLGKLCKLYDDAVADLPNQQELLAAFVDQYADGTTDSLEAVALFPTYTSQWQSAINGGVSGLRAIALAAAGSYLATIMFDDFVEETPAAETAAAVLAALQVEMAAGADNVTLTTKASTGLVNFFDAILGSAGTWNTEAEASPSMPDYPDSTYVVAAVIAD